MRSLGMSPTIAELKGYLKEKSELAIFLNEQRERSAINLKTSRVFLSRLQGEAE